MAPNTGSNREARSPGASDLSVVCEPVPGVVDGHGHRLEVHVEQAGDRQARVGVRRPTAGEDRDAIELADYGISPD
jgi:hypothetical protein